MRKTIATILLAIALAAARTAAAAVIGSWNTYTSYHDIERIEPTGKHVFVQASGGLYMYNPADNSTTAYNKLNGLNGTDIAVIRWNATARRLLVVYTDGNIDLVATDGTVTNIPDLYNKAMTDDKTIYGASTAGRYAYVATGFGIVKVDMQRAEIADTYNIGHSTRDAIEYGGYIIAATWDGVYRARLTDNLADKAVWRRMSGHIFTEMLSIGGQLFASRINYFGPYNIETGAFSETFKPNYTQLQKLADRALLYGKGTTTVVRSATDRATVGATYAACCYDAAAGCYWASDTDGTLARVTLDSQLANPEVTVTGIRPDGPATNNIGRIRLYGGQLYTVAGSYPETAIQTYDGNTWQSYDESFTDTLSHTFRNLIDIAVDPTDQRRTLVTSSSGLYQYYDRRLEHHWTYLSSPLMPAVTVGTPGTTPDATLKTWTVVGCAAYAPDGTAWIANTISPSTSLFTIAPDGKWTSHHDSQLMQDGRSLDGMRDMMFDSRGLLWLVNDYYTKPALIRVNPATGEMKLYTSFVNQDGTQVSVIGVRCVTEDTDHNIWIGTNVGPLMLSAADIASGGDTFQQHKIPRNDGTNLADYLLSGVDISDIVVDGGGRKWIGTNTNGLYLIGADNITQLSHFTAENSPLLSNTIRCMAMNGTTGELFVSTPSGLCSYMTDSSDPAGEMSKDNVWAYPNPVRPDYDGLVTVTGLTLNADVKIVTANGTLVAEGRSSGGTFTWDTRDTRGRRVASGVYMVVTATADGGKGTVCKIAVVN